MYMQIEQKYRCSKCGSTAYPIFVTKGLIMYWQCSCCKHEYQYAEMTISGQTTGDTSSYTYVVCDPPEEIVY